MKIAIIGFGKMGQTIAQLAKEQGDSVCLTIDVENRNDLNSKMLQNCDVAIEFSRPESAFSNISACLKSGVPVVSGTTGWLHKLPDAKELCKTYQTAFFYASNFSIGVNIFFEINRRLAAIMDSFPEYDIRMEEIHHIQKLDAPSGTAITLANDILENIDRKTRWVNDQLPGKNDLLIHSEREGWVPGTHIVTYESSVDTIEIKHEAHSRMGFARGALLAAKWIIGKKGYFEMKDILSSGK